MGESPLQQNDGSTVQVGLWQNLGKTYGGCPGKAYEARTTAYLRLALEGCTWHHVACHSIMPSAAMKVSTNVKHAVWLAAVATCLKLLLMPAYHSTDFEVHRHWMAITHSLPMAQWYLDETSPWTLDYPPFFAWFERALALGAAWVDPTIVDLQEGLNNASPRTVLYQRGSVMVADSLLVYATWRFCRHMSGDRFLLVMSAVLFSPGLLMVDHIHFQYNGFLLGLLLLSLAMLQERKYVTGAALFAVLVCMKHLFAVAGPLFFVVLLRNHCQSPCRVSKFLGLGFTVLTVAGIAFGPFAYFGQIPTLLSRLFPFGRGLLHAYWAPNFWALYASADKVAGLWLRASPPPQAALTGGLVGDASPFSVLPSITPPVSLSLVLISMLPCLLQAWRSPPSPSNLIRWTAYVYVCGFLFGWHVHEKAALHFVLPLALLAAETPADARLFFFLSAVSSYSLFPLLFHHKEYPLKLSITALYLLGLKCGSPQALLTHLSDSDDSESGADGGEGMGAGGEKDGRDDGMRKRDGGETNEAGESIKETTWQQGGLQLNAPVRNSFGSNNLLKDGDEERRKKGRAHAAEIVLCLRERLENVYLCGIVFLEICVQVMHPLVLGKRLPFLPLVAISVYSAVGMVYVWLSLLHIILSDSNFKVNRN